MMTKSNEEPVCDRKAIGARNDEYEGANPWQARRS
jgi:hypothetical protein